MFKKLFNPTVDYTRDLTPKHRQRVACLSAAMKVTDEKPHGDNAVLFRAALVLAATWLRVRSELLRDDMSWAWQVLGLTPPV